MNDEIDKKWTLTGNLRFQERTIALSENIGTTRRFLQQEWRNPAGNMSQWLDVPCVEEL